MPLTPMSLIQTCTPDVVGADPPPGTERGGARAAVTCDVHGECPVVSASICESMKNVCVSSRK